MHPSIQRLARGLAAACALFCLTFGLAAHPAHAQAGYYTYTLNDVSFNAYGSGTASGYFDYDPTTGQLGAFDINTSAGTLSDGSSTAGLTYSSVDGDVAENGDNLNYFFVFINGNNAFELESPTALTSAPATELVGSAEGTDDGTPPDEEVTANDPFREGFTGTLTASPAGTPNAVPELPPLAAIALLSVLGSAALGAAGMKRRRSVSSVV